MRGITMSRKEGINIIVIIGFIIVDGSIVTIYVNLMMFLTHAASNTILSFFS